MIDYLIREMKKQEYALLHDFLYEAIFIPEGVQAPPRSILDQPELQVYVENFGERADDFCLVAEAAGKVIGAVWVRDMEDYGHIGKGIPSFAISLYKEYRRLGIGTELMKRMLAELKRQGYEKASLSVQKTNYAARMYRKLGFEVIRETEEEWVMVCDLKIVYKKDKSYSVTDLRELFLSVNWLSGNYPERVKKALDQCETVITAWKNNRLVGLVNAMDDGELTAYVHYLCVNPEYQGLGIGGDLLRQIKEKYKDYLYIILIAENKKLVAFYEKNGFEHIAGRYVLAVQNG